MKKKTIFGLIVLSTAVLLSAVIWQWPAREPWIQVEDPELLAEVSYQCRDNKQIEADYSKRLSVPLSSDGRPVPDGKVALRLSDGRKLILFQTISASGIRYADTDESLVFWSKGESAFITENGVETYSDCLISQTES